MSLSIEERQNIKKKLPTGSISLIANRTGTSRMSVHNYLKGKFRNLKIEKEVVEIYCEVLRQEKELRNKIEDAKR